MKSIKVTIERGHDGIYTAIPDHNYPVGFIGCGKTVEAATADLFHSWKEAKEICPELPEMTFTFAYDTASFLHYYAGKISLAGLQAITGINRKQLSHYLTGHRRPTAATVHRIEAAIHQFSQELNRVSLV